MKSFHRRIDADLKPVPGWPDEQATAGNDRASRHVVGFELDPHRIAEMHDDQMIIGRIHLRTERRFILLGEKEDRKSVVSGKSVSVRVDLGGRRIIKKKTNTYTYFYRPLNEYSPQSTYHN